MSPIDDTKIFAQYAADWMPVFSGDVEYIDINDYTRYSFSILSSFFDVSDVENDSYISESWFDDSNVYCCILEKPGNENASMYHMFLYDFNDNSTTLIYQNHMAANIYKDANQFQTNAKRDRVASVILNEGTGMYELILFQIGEKLMENNIVSNTKE